MNSTKLMPFLEDGSPKKLQKKAPLLLILMIILG